MALHQLDMSGRTVLVTGGAKRIGRAICLTLANAGADVLVHCNSSVDEAEQVVADITSLGRGAGLVRGDLRTELEGICDEVSSSELVRQRGGLDLLVNSASIFERASMDSIEPADFERMLRINTVAPFEMIQRLLPDLRSVSGCAVNLLDTSIERPWPFYSHYCASKAALASLTLSLAGELAPEVRVNGVAPGAILFSDVESPAERESVMSRIPMGRTGTPEEIAQTVLFLAAGPSYITGQIIAVDGGWSLSDG